MSVFVCVLLGGVVMATILHATQLTSGYLKSQIIFLRLKYDRPEASPRLARIYCALNAIIVLTLGIPLYWVMAHACHRYFDGDWVRFANFEVDRAKSRGDIG